uniref:Sodium-coupled monocarboxylate transporter 1 n=1 Tax=Clastoptera arizonana TaxID=38151 RepID=A0A1B6DCF3_9HEMI
MEGKELYFNWTDYIVFVIMLGLSALIGAYYGFYKGNQNTVSEYLMGSKKMSIFPIAMSLIASHVSGVTIIGVPSEMYLFGTQLFAANIANIFVTIIVINILIPVFFKLQLNSLYEYLELRFDVTVRKFAAFLFAISLILYIPVVVYVPALAFNQVSGADIHVVAPFICAVCIFYTTVGGLKAVVWTDALQGLTTISAIFAVIIIGIYNVGGLSEVFRISDEGQRLELFNMDPNPLRRSSLWSVSIGYIFIWLTYLGIHPGSVQRFLSLPTESKAKWSAFFLAIGMSSMTSICCLLGLIIYATYHDCDLVSSKLVTRHDQLVPYYVLDVAEKYRGLPGLVVAGIVCAALSTMSAGLNTLSGILFEDFIRPIMPGIVPEKTASCIMKFVVVILGIICVIMVFVIEKMGEIYQLTLILGGATNGPLLGLFTLGLLLPWANIKGAMTGALTSLLFMGWIIYGAQTIVASGKVLYPYKPSSVVGCSFNVTVEPQNLVNPDEVFPLFRLSFFYYVLLGWAVTVVIGLIVSFLTGPQDLKHLNHDLISPVMHRFLPRRLSESELFKMNGGKKAKELGC